MAEKRTRKIVARIRGEDDDATGGTRSTPMDAWVSGRIRLRRQELGRSQARQAEIMGLGGQQQLAKYESGQWRLYAGVIFQFAKGLDIHPGWFFEDFPGVDVPADRGEIMTRLLDMPEATPFLKLFGQLTRDQREAILTMLRGMVPQG